MTGHPSKDELIKRNKQLEKELSRTKKALEDFGEIKDKFRNILESIQEGYFELDLAGNYTFVNDANCRFLGYAREELIGMNARQHTPSKEIYEELQTAYTNLYLTGNPIESLEVEAIRKDGAIMFYETSVTLRRNTKGEIVGFRGVSRDITGRKQMEKEREQLIEKLQKTLSEVKKLSGLLPICASCKKIRNDEGYWEQIESFIKARSETEFSHGICPECMNNLYPEKDYPKLYKKK